MSIEDLPNEILKIIADYLIGMDKHRFLLSLPIIWRKRIKKTLSNIKR